MDLVRPYALTDDNLTSNIEYIAPATWFSGITYPLGFLVNYNDVLYRCSDLVSFGAQPDLNPSQWDVVSTGTQMYDAGATYGVGDRVFVSVASSLTKEVYESLTAGNVGNDPATSPTEWILRQTVYAAYNRYHGYPNGVTVTYNKKLYQGLAGSNTNHTPDINPSWWLDLGPANRWAMFDAKTGTQTTSDGGSVQFSVDVTGTADTVTVFNIEATNLNITIMDGATEAYNQDFNLIVDDVYDWWGYFFDDITYVSDKVVFNLPNVLDPTITVTLTGEAVKVGFAQIGTRKEIGITMRDPTQTGIDDASKKVRDEFGVWTFVERNYAKVGTFEVLVPNLAIDGISRVLTFYRATPVVFIGAEEYTSTYFFGIAQNWRFKHGATHATLSIEISGL